MTERRDYIMPDDLPLPHSWGIRAFADMFDTTPRTIRFYESKGLLDPDRESGSRRFGPREYVRLERIQRAKRLGFSLDDIREVLEIIDGEVSDRAELTRRRANFQRVLSGLDRRRADIDAVATDMRDLVAQIDDHLDRAESSTETIFLKTARAYESRFRQSLLS